LTSRAIGIRASSLALRAIDELGDLWIVIVLLALVAFFTIATPNGTFLTFGNLRDVILNTTEILVLAAGVTFILIAAGIDLSVGSVVVFCSIIAAKTLGFASGGTDAGYPNPLAGLAVALPVTLIAGAAWGLLNGSAIVKLKVPAFIVTLGTLGMALGLAQIISGGLNVASVPPQLQVAWIGPGLFGEIPWPVVFTAVIVGALWIVLARTRFGLHTYALGSNREALRRSGVNVDRHTVALYALLGLLGGTVAFMDVLRFSSASLAAHQLDNLNAIAAVVIGGTSLFGGRGRMSGTVIGAFIPAVLRNGFIVMGVEAFWQNVVVGAVLIVAVYVDQLRRGAFVTWRQRLAERGR
jgi:ribose transport system permease protein